MIKNWKMFLESVYDDDDDDGKDRLKKDMLKTFGTFIDNMSEKRPTMSEEEIIEVADSVVEMFTEIFKESVSRRDWPEVIKEKVFDFFIKSLNLSRETMIKDSFRNGFIHLIDEFTTLLDSLKGNDDEGEEWKQEKERGYEDLSKKEIQNLIDIALDNRDFDEVRRLSQYLESYTEFNIESDIEKIVNDIMNYIDLIIV